MIAAGRAGRPGAWLPEIDPATADELERCPFCGGREDRTPPEVLRLGADPWQVRVVPNLYPAFERQEVVIHSPEHVRSFAELPDENLPLIADAWQQRSEAARNEGYAYVHTFVNEGRLAGASLPHSHSQLVWLREEPAAASVAHDRVAELLEHEELRVASRGDAVAAVHHAGAWPYESVVAGDPVADLLFLLRELVRRLRALEGARPWNAWLSSSGTTRLHFVPRLTALAGLELGAGLYVNVVPPELAAERLRGP